MKVIDENGILRKLSTIHLERNILKKREVSSLPNIDMKVNHRSCSIVAILTVLVFLLPGCNTNRLTDGECLRGDCVNGTGTMMFPEGRFYSGQFKNGLSHGFGVFRDRQGNRYEGQWVEGLKSGVGEYRYPDGSIYSGGFEENLKHGKGKYVWNDGTTLSGLWNSGEPIGRCTLTLPEGRQMIGLYQDGIIQNGSGIFIYDDGSRYIGEWKDGQREGTGVLLDGKGNTIYTGKWTDDRPVE